MIRIICDTCGQTIETSRAAYRLIAVRHAKALELDLCSPRCLIAMGEQMDKAEVRTLPKPR